MNKNIAAQLVTHMGDDKMVVNAARVTHGAICELFGDRDRALINFLAQHKHVTPFRHPQVHLRCKSPIFLARQLGKHQTGFSWNEVSRRYKDGEAINIDYYMPQIVLQRPEKLMTQKARPASTETSVLAQTIIESSYNESQARYMHLLSIGVAPEQARMVLPQGMVTEWVWTGSLFGWASLYNQRSSEHAQYEANLFAEDLNDIMLELFPVSWKALTNKG